MSGDRFSEHNRLLSTNPKMRAELLADPKAALASYFGAVVDGDYRIAWVLRDMRALWAGGGEDDGAGAGE